MEARAPIVARNFARLSVVSNRQHSKRYCGWIVGIIWSLIFDDFIVTLIYCVAFGSLSGFVLMNWLKMWIHLPEYYKSCFIDLYKNKLQIKSED